MTLMAYSHLVVLYLTVVQTSVHSVWVSLYILYIVYFYIVIAILYLKGSDKRLKSQINLNYPVLLSLVHLPGN